MIVLESDKEYLGYTLSKEGEKFDKLHAKVNILNNSTIYLESFLQEKKDLIRNLKHNPLVS